MTEINTSKQKPNEFKEYKVMKEKKEGKLKRDELYKVDNLSDINVYLLLIISQMVNLRKYNINDL